MDGCRDGTHKFRIVEGNQVWDSEQTHVTWAGWGKGGGMRMIGVTSQIVKKSINLPMVGNKQTLVSPPDVPKTLIQ